MPATISKDDIAKNEIMKVDFVRGIENANLAGLCFLARDSSDINIKNKRAIE
ncbi:hypothetical protein GCM10011367_17450 [Marinicauda pacifica]|nr:hypothetical protein GCM10011367_17450 [Marinicauda pacifica]